MFVGFHILAHRTSFFTQQVECLWRLDLGLDPHRLDRLETVPFGLFIYMAENRSPILDVNFDFIRPRASTPPINLRRIAEFLGFPYSSLIPFMPHSSPLSNIFEYTF